MTFDEFFESLPLSEKTLRKRILQNTLPFLLLPSFGHPCEYHLRTKQGEICGMVKYYRGRLLSYYTIKGVKFDPVKLKIKGRTDKFGRKWPFPKNELCSVCGQPDNCGDCDHTKLTDSDVNFLKTGDW